MDGPPTPIRWMNIKRKDLQNRISQLIDSKRDVYGRCWTTSIELAAPKTEKREQSSGTPNRVFYSVNYALGYRKSRKTWKCSLEKRVSFRLRGQSCCLCHHS